MVERDYGNEKNFDGFHHCLRELLREDLCRMYEYGMENYA